MRIASWVLVACCALAAIGVWFPAIETRPGALPGNAVARRMTLSLYQAASDRQLARRLLAAYRTSHGPALGVQLLGAMERPAHGRLKGALDDAHDALDALRGISDADAGKIGTSVAVAVGVFVAIEIVIALIALVQAVGGIYRRARAIGVLVLALIGAAIATASWLACKQVVFEINDDVSYPITGLGLGAWLSLVGAIGALLAGISLLVAHIHASRR